MPEQRATAKSKKQMTPMRGLLWTMLAGVVFGLIGLGLPLDYGLRTLRATVISHPASDSIVIVKIDDASLRKVGNWPWSRASHAKMVDELSRLGARQILFDIFFTYPADPAGDAAFADAIKRSGRVVLPVLTGPIVKNKVYPQARFAKFAQLADVTLLYKFDTKVHAIDFASDIPLGRIPSMAAKLAGLKTLPAGEFPIDYSIDPRTYKSISASDLIEGKVPAGVVAGKAVLVGTTTDILGDQFYLPKFGRMGGVYIHAVAANTLIDGRPFDAGWGLGLVLAGLFSVVGLYRRRPISQNATLIAALLIVCAGPLALEDNLIFVDASPALFVLLITIWRLNWSRLRNRSTVNDVSGLPNLNALRADTALRDRPLVVARLHNYAEIVSALPSNAEPQFVEQVTSRLCVGATGRKLYHGDEGLFAWFAEPVIPLGHHLEALHALFRSPVKVRGSQYDIMISFGVDIGSERAATNRLGSAVVAANEAETEGLKWKYHDPARLADASWKLSLLSQLDEAIEGGQVWVAYQPKLNLGTGDIVGVEALARWTHPEKGPISPGEFIGAAEQHDRIERLTNFILDEAISAVMGSGPDGHALSLSVNLSARLLNDPDLPGRVAACLARHGMPPEQLTLELTETAALTGSGQDIQMLTRLQQTGVKISIDDYGTGLSTLDYLKKVPAHEIKIDQTFIKSLRDHRSDRVMVQSTIGLAHSLGRIVVAEGVEDMETLEILTSMGCDIAQGFIIGRATSLRSVIKRMHDTKGRRVA